MGCLLSKTEETRRIMPRARLHRCTDLWETVCEQTEPTGSSLRFATKTSKHELKSTKKLVVLARPTNSPIIPSAETQTEIASEKEIEDLANDDLVQVFTHLPPFDRLIASEVCRRWYEVGRRKWLDVIELDLSPIPSKNIGAIVRQCPNLRSVFALNKCFEVDTLACLICRSSKLSVVKFYYCTFAVKSKPNVVSECFGKIFSANLPQASWNELVLHGARMDDCSVPERVPSPEWVFLNDHPSFTRPMWAFSAAFLPASLTRLQLSGLWVRYASVRVVDQFLNGLEHLQSLECLLLHQTASEHERLDQDLVLEAFDSRSSSICEKIGVLKGLKELCIGPVYGLHLSLLIPRLPKLEVLFLNDAYSVETELKTLITENRVLRILVLSGALCRFSDPDVVQLPARKRFPNGFGGEPLPLLHIFVAEAVSKKFRFSASSSDAAIIHRLNKPLPEFLARADIAPFFEGVWFAEKIKETAENVGKLRTWK